MILPLCFWTEEELQSIPSEDLWCEIADAMFYSSYIPQVDAYIKRIDDELKQRDEINN
jgi:hypothetical protein